MPLFRKSTQPNEKVKLEHKLRIAKDTPEPSFDLSDCNASQVPAGVFSMCRVFRKEELLLSRNNLTTLKGGGILQDLSCLKILDLSYNKFTQLPEEFGFLESVQTLYLNNNQLKKLPDSFEKLIKLESLDLSENILKVLPDFLGNLTSLKTLNITGNLLTKLPSSLVQLRAFSDLKLDVEKFVFPPTEICQEGTETILKFLCDEQHIEYQPPSQDSLSSSSRGASISSLASLEASPVTPHPPDTFQQHQLAKDRRRKDLLEMEEAMRRNERSQFDLNTENTLRRQQLLNDYKQEQERIHTEIQLVQNKKEREKIQLFDALNDLEVHSALLISDILELNERAKSSDAIALAIERDRIEAEELFAIKQIELEDVRRKEVLISMKETLAAEEKQRVYQALRLEQTRRNTESPLMQDKRIRDLILDREQDQQALFSQLLEEEELQRLAFHALQVQKDAQHFNLTQQIKLIERELAKLTEAEIRRKEKMNGLNINAVAEQRATLAELLSSLLTQRDIREDLLMQRLREMEENRVLEIKDYWLIQYQTLMDRKPQEILDMELAMDPIVRQLLIQVGAQRYLSRFAIAEVSLEQIVTMNDENLYGLGVADSRIRKSILLAAQEAFGITDDKTNVCRVSPPTSHPCSPVEPSAPSPVLSPSAPEPDREISEDIQGVIASGNILSKVWHQAECVICLDRKSNIVFLPCGHVCACWPCAKDIQLCPLCRVDIKSKLTIGSL